MNGLQLTLWLGRGGHERPREECSRPSERVTTDPRDNDYAE